MINNVSSALNAYQQALSRINANEQKIAEVEQPKVSGFGNMVKSAVQDVANLSKQAEVTSIAGIQGKADIQDVVLAVSNAEVALETVVAVRDTAIKAYNTIMQMPI
ncbi:MAG: flagellar hook-basal body complex protein FliE [Alphaproteobacteria bacterium]|nr:flagellar hook-basal body complex protein FliE [Alphaproteobacteria bacterium]